MRYLLIIAGCFTLAAQEPLPSPTSGSGGSSSGTASAVRKGLLVDIPLTCAVGDIYWATDASIATGGWKIYSCTAVNVWNFTGMIAGPSGALDCSLSAIPNQTMCDVVAGIFGLAAGNNTWTGTNSFAGATHTIPQQVIAVDPVNCTVGESYVDTTASPALAYDCLTINVWTRRTPPDPSLTTSTVGHFFPFAYPQGQANTAALVNATVYYDEFVADINISVKKMVVYNDTAGPSQFATMGLYTSACALISQTDVIDVNASAGGPQVFTFASVVPLARNTSYFWAVAVSGAAAWKFYQGVSVIGPAVLNAESTKRAFTGSNAIGSSGATMTLPATCGTRSATNFLQAPSVAFLP